MGGGAALAIHQPRPGAGAGWRRCAGQRINEQVWSLIWDQLQLADMEASPDANATDWPLLGGKLTSCFLLQLQRRPLRGRRELVPLRVRPGLRRTRLPHQ